MDLLTTAQAAERLGVSIQRVQAVIASGRLPAQRIGRDLLVRASDVARYKPLPVGWRKGRKRGRKA